MENRIKVVSQLPTPNIIEIYLVNKASQTRKVGVLEMPTDGNLSANIELAEKICQEIKKRIGKGINN